jgi:hypothetical protein
MSENSQFWLNWILNLAVAIGTTGAVIIALFGDWIRSKLFKSSLSIKIDNPNGVLTTGRKTIRDTNGEMTQEFKGRYYHAKIYNKKAWPRSSQVQVFIVQVETPGPDNELLISWSGDIPLRWRHQEAFPFARNIGAPADCDLFAIIREQYETYLQLDPLIIPNNLKAKYTGPTKLVVSIQARSNEGESDLQKLQIAWDGNWAEGEIEMGKHAIVKAQ